MMDNAAVEQMSFEEALAALEEIVRRMETGKVKLDDAIACYEQGTMLRKHCEKKLADARLKIDKITTSLNGEATGISPLPME